MFFILSQEVFLLDFLQKLSNYNFDNHIPEWFKTMVNTGNDLIWAQFLIGLLLLA